MPVERDGQLRSVLTAILELEAFVDVFQSQALPNGWVTSVFDRRGPRIARSHDHDRHLNTKRYRNLASEMD